MKQIELMTDEKTTDPEHRVVMLSRLWRMLLRIPNIVDTVKYVAKFQGCHTQALAITDCDRHDVTVYVQYVGFRLFLWVEDKKGLNVRWEIWSNLISATEVNADTYISTVSICADREITDIKKLEHITEPYSDDEIVAEVMEFLYDYSDFGDYYD